jgi:hypothetical protein
MMPACGGHRPFPRHARHSLCRTPCARARMVCHGGGHVDPRGPAVSASG